MLDKSKIELGASEEGIFHFKKKVLQRHLGCFGSSGSGKTVASKVLIEELAINGVPVIAFDPQGDISSLVLMEDKHILVENNVAQEKNKYFTENVEVIIWTPGSDKGLPICINPMNFEEIQDLNDKDKLGLFSAAAKNIASIIGYDLSSDDGKTASVILESIFFEMSSSKVKLNTFEELSYMLSNPSKITLALLKQVSTEKWFNSFKRKINLLNVGSRKLLFQNGMPADIDVLIGRDSKSSKTRISVIYLNGLNHAEEKEFFIASILQSLYQWMLKNPLKNGQDGLQCALFIDEIAPYIPPVKKPATKESLELILRQGRKYGIGCIVATQSPGDIDYKAIGQLSSLSLGSINTKQDIANVKRRLESLAPNETDYIIKSLPALKPGEFLFVSPDAFDSVKRIKIRWLMTKHTVLSESQLVSLIDNDFRKLYEEPYKLVDSQLNHNTQFEKDVKRDSVKKIIDLNKDDKETRTVYYMRHKIFEREIHQRIKPYLEGTFIKKESLEKAEFKYLPLIKVELTFFSKKGVFKNKIEEINENLYIHYKTYNIFYMEDNLFQFSSVVDQDPNRIYDLDNIGKIEIIDRDKIEYDFRSLGKNSINGKKIKVLMERKYDVKVHSSVLVLFPTWECLVRSKNGDTKRLAVLDGLIGNEIIK